MVFSGFIPDRVRIDEKEGVGDKLRLNASFPTGKNL